ncbi:MAG: serine/threonine protein kinase [Deltaproteobacteria bacterium]|nr:serine/threonine protein kinase [Deltaproteobacteria bacterium]
MHAPTPMLEPGQRVGRYRVLGTLGRGGMGGVFDVEDDEGRRFALKSPLTDVGGNPNVTRRFAREANALRLLEHPNLVAAIDVFVEAGMLFLVMEKVDGVTLGKTLRNGPLAPRQALVIARQILEGMAHAHAQGIVHRDLKPDNVILVPMGGWDRVKVIDFGLVKLVGDAAAAFGAGALTSTGLVFGTPAYMAPEQALGRAVDGRADVYATGVILFEMLAGRMPFVDSDPMVLMRLHAKQPPPRLDELTRGAPWCTPQLLGLVEGALIKDPAQRFASAAMMVTALDDAFQSLDHIA